MTDSPSREPHRQRLHWPLALVLLALIVAAVFVMIFLRLETWPARTAAQGTAQLERLGRDLRATFLYVAHLQPKITIKDRVYFEQSTEAAELTTVTRRTQVEHEFLHTWAGSTKRIQLRGIFLVKAGFDLHKNFSVNVSESAIDVELPPAQILSVDEEKIEVLAFENGFWNRISTADVENEMQILPELARKKAQTSGLVADAERMLKEQLEQKIGVHEPVRVNFVRSPAPSPPAINPAD